MSAPLYNAEILRLAASTAGFARLSAPDATIEKRSPVCGSRIIVDVILDDQKRLETLGIEVRACALGQAASALMAAHAIGLGFDELDAGRAQLSDFLANGAESVGTWPGLEIFTPARPHFARHASIRLAFEAVVEAVELAQR